MHEAMTRGHAERLAPMVADVLAQAQLTPTALAGIAVTTGPGSFTGARLGVSFARGLALATNIPATGVSVFEAMASDTKGEWIVALPGKNGALLLQHFRDATPVAPPAEHTAESAWPRLPTTGDLTITGSAASALLDVASDDVKARVTIVDGQDITAQIIAEIGSGVLADGNAVLPAPLYLRPPDAKPQETVTLG